MPFAPRLKAALSVRAQAVLRSLAARYLRPSTTPQRMPARCSRCGAEDAFLINTAVHPDFDLSILPPQLRPAFMGHLDAICVNCGLYQAYRRFSEEEVDAVNGIGKDALSTDEAYHSYPVPKEFIDAWYGDSVDRQRRRWGKALRELGLQPKRVLFLRSWFGRTLEMFAREFGAEVYALDVSPVCVQHVREHHPLVHQLTGSINGLLKGDFLDGPPFDGVVTQHVLVHANNPPQFVRQFRHLVRDGGFVLLNAETKVAPDNPFHKFYPTEYQLTSLLRDEFDEVYKLDEMGVIAQEDWRQYCGSAVEFLGVHRGSTER
jgi:SAM-dependent methyltransferase